MEKYYIKLKSQKGQIDASFISKKEFELKLLDCEIIYSNFENIKENAKILFEFKNGDSGENKVISQANNYQINAKALFKGEPFYHIIIIRSRKLGNLLGEILDVIQKKIT